MAKKGLGRGLGSLFDADDEIEETSKSSKKASVKSDKSVNADKSETAIKAKTSAKSEKSNNNSDITYIKLSLIEPNKNQPRQSFDEDKIAILAESIKENGLIQPIIITAEDNGMYKIVAGERRWRASKKAGLKEIPVLIRSYSDEQVAEVALVENLQREDLNPIEEALGYNLLIDEFSLTQELVSQKVGKSRSAVANSLRLLSLDNEIKNFLINGQLSSGHARAILSIDEPELRLAMAKRIIDDNLNVRQSEALAKTISKKPAKKKPEKSSAELAATEELENKLSSSFGTKVRVKGNSKKGKIEIEYFGNDDLDRILNIFNI